MNSNFLKEKNYRINYPITIPEELIEDKIKEFKNGKSLLHGCIIVHISKVSLEYEGEIICGINLVLVNIQKIIIDLEKYINDTFFIKLIDEEGNNADKCFLTKKNLPYLFYYCNQKLEVIE
mgnify:FL=1|jgi:hypothetical protein